MISHPANTWNMQENAIIIPQINTLPWTFYEEKEFERYIGLHFELGETTLLSIIAQQFAGRRTLVEIYDHYMSLLYDVESIERGCVPLPEYNEPNNDVGQASSHHLSQMMSTPELVGPVVSQRSTPEPIVVVSQRGAPELIAPIGSLIGPAVSQSSSLRSIPEPNPNSSPGSVIGTVRRVNGKKDCKTTSSQQWSKEEHELFLVGIQLYGKGDWRSISRHVVGSRSPGQVASHAQKFYARKTSESPRGRKRTSIHDIDTVDIELVNLWRSKLFPKTEPLALDQASPTPQPTQITEPHDPDSNQQYEPATQPATTALIATEPHPSYEHISLNSILYQVPSRPPPTTTLIVTEPNLEHTSSPILLAQVAHHLSPQSRESIDPYEHFYSPLFELEDYVSQFQPQTTQISNVEPYEHTSDSQGLREVPHHHLPPQTTILDQSTIEPYEHTSDSQGLPEVVPHHHLPPQTTVLDHDHTIEPFEHTSDSQGLREVPYHHHLLPQTTVLDHDHTIEPFEHTSDSQGLREVPYHHHLSPQTTVLDCDHTIEPYEHASVVSQGLTEVPYHHLLPQTTALDQSTIEPYEHIFDSHGLTEVPHPYLSPQTTVLDHDHIIEPYEHAFVWQELPQTTALDYDHTIETYEHVYGELFYDVPQFQPQTTHTATELYEQVSYTFDDAQD